MWVGELIVLTNASRLKQTGLYYAGEISKYIFFSENLYHNYS